MQKKFYEEGVNYKFGDEKDKEEAKTYCELWMKYFLQRNHHIEYLSHVLDDGGKVSFWEGDEYEKGVYWIRMYVNYKKDLQAERGYCPFCGCSDFGNHEKTFKTGYNPPKQGMPD